jgi:hypothetical protein
MVPCSNESWQLTGPIWKGEIDRGLFQNWSTSKDRLSPVYLCQTDCMCGLGLSCPLPRNMRASEPRDIQIRSTQNQEVPGKCREQNLIPLGKSWFRISEPIPRTHSCTWSWLSELTPTDQSVIQLGDSIQIEFPLWVTWEYAFFRKPWTVHSSCVHSLCRNYTVFLKMRSTS